MTAPTTRETADHAELARLAEAAARQWPSSGMITWFTRDGGHLDDMEVEDREFIAAMSPAVCSALLSEIAALRGERERLRTAVSKSNDEICQSLGKALGYPWFKDDQANFPGSTEAAGVCVGDHVAESIADEAARRLTEAERQRDELRKAAETAANLFKLCTEPTMFENVSTLNVYAQMTEWLVRNRPLIANQDVK